LNTKSEKKKPTSLISFEIPIAKFTFNDSSRTQISVYKAGKSFYELVPM